MGSYGIRVCSSIPALPFCSTYTFIPPSNVAFLNLVALFTFPVISYQPSHLISLHLNKTPTWHFRHLKNSAQPFNIQITSLIHLYYLHHSISLEELRRVGLSWYGMNYEKV